MRVLRIPVGEYVSFNMPTREQHIRQGVFWRFLGRHGLQPDPSKTAQSICAFFWTGKLRKWQQNPFPELKEMYSYSCIIYIHELL